MVLNALIPSLLNNLHSGREAGELEPTVALVHPASRGYSVLLKLRPGDVEAVLVEHRDSARLTQVPHALWRRLPELELLRRGDLEMANLHPLVRSALFPELPTSDEYQPPDPGVETTTKVRCRGVWHEIGFRDGKIELADHPPEEIERERAMRSLGGEVPRCFEVTQVWRGAEGALPRTLRKLRAYALRLIAHADAEGFENLLDLGVDPTGVRDRWNRGPLHQLAKLNAPDLIPRLIEAGLDINEPDLLSGGTPLHCVLRDGASAGLVRAMLDAGADPTVRSRMDETVLHWMRSVDATTILPWLLAAGLDLDGHDRSGRSPLMAQVLNDAPPETVLATLTAGADPTSGGTVTGDELVKLLRRRGRNDLGFLVAAARAGERP